MKSENSLPFVYKSLNNRRRQLQAYREKQIQHINAELRRSQSERQELYELLFHAKQEPTPDFSELYPCAMNTPQPMPEGTE